MNLKEGDTQLIIKECEDRNLTVEQAAYVLATAKWETNHTMKPVREAYWLSEEWRKNNLRYYPYYGRGYVQLTWLDNYKKATDKLGYDLVNNADDALLPQYAVPILVLGMLEGWFTGKKLSDYIGVGKTDYVEARRIINGVDKKYEIASIASEYEEALRPEYGKNNLFWKFIKGFFSW